MAAVGWPVKKKEMGCGGGLAGALTGMMQVGLTDWGPGAIPVDAVGLSVLVRGVVLALAFFFSSSRRHTRLRGDWSSDVCSSDLCGGRTRPAPDAHWRHRGDGRQ